jgi:hypothetical protein
MGRSGLVWTGAEAGAEAYAIPHIQAKRVSHTGGTIPLWKDSHSGVIWCLQANLPPLFKGHKAIIVSVHLGEERIESGRRDYHTGLLEGRPQFLPRQPTITVSVDVPKKRQKLCFGMVDKCPKLCRELAQVHVPWSDQAS